MQHTMFGNAMLVLLVFFKATGARNHHHYDNNLCFHGSSKVQLEGGTMRKLEEVRVGDRILTANFQKEVSYKPVIFMPHAANSKESVFRTVRTRSALLHVTSLHLLQDCHDGKFVQANKIIPNDTCLSVINGNETATSISISIKKGTSTVITENELVVVNGFIASPFSYSHAIPGAFYRFMMAVIPTSNLDLILQGITETFGPLIL